MTQRDYILRVIEQAGQALLALRRQILGQKVSTEEVDRALSGIAHESGLDLELARMASGDTLLMMVGPTGEVEPGRCWVLAEALYLDGLDAQLGDDPERARLSYDKALRLFNALQPGGLYLVGLPEASARVEEIEGRLQKIDELPQETERDSAHS